MELSEAYVDFLLEILSLPLTNFAVVCGVFRLLVMVPIVSIMVPIASGVLQS